MSHFNRGGKGGSRGEFKRNLRFDAHRGGARQGSTSGNESASSIGSKGNFRGMGRSMFPPLPQSEKIEEVVANMKKDPKYDAIQPFRRAGMFCPWYVKELLLFPGKVQAYKLVHIYEKSLNDNEPDEEMDEEQVATEKSLAEKALQCLNSSDPLDLASLPTVQKSGGSERTRKRRQRRLNQLAKSDSDTSAKTSPVKVKKQKSIIGVSPDATPKGARNKIKKRTYRRSQSSCSSVSTRESVTDDAQGNLVYKSDKVGGAVGGSMIGAGVDRTRPGPSHSYPTGANALLTPYEPNLMANQCKRITNFPSLTGQRAEIGRFKEQFKNVDPVHARSSDVFCSSKVRGMARKKYVRMEDQWTVETSKILNQTARVATVVQSRTIGLTLDVIYEFREQVPELFSMYKAAFNPEGWN